MNIALNNTEGFAHTTQFKLSEVNTTQIILKNTWDFGDGSIYYDTPTVTHTYKIPGVYNINYKSIDFTGTTTSSTSTVIVKNVVYDAIAFTKIPEFYGDPGRPSGIFTVNVTSSNITEDIYIDLHAANSKSLPADFAKPGYLNITPVWYFTEAYPVSTTSEYNKVSNFKVNTTTLTATSDSGDVVSVGVSGTVSFRYVDSVATGIPEYEKPILLTATLRTSAFSYYKDSSYIKFNSYSNSDVRSATIAWQTNYLPVSSLRVLQDDMNVSRGVNEVNWTYSTIPFVITARNARTPYASAEEVESINFSYPDTISTDPNSNVNKTFIKILTSNNIDFAVDETLYEKPTSTCCTEYAYENNTNVINITGVLNESAYILTQDTTPVSSLKFEPYDSQGITSHGIVYGSLSTVQPCEFARISAVAYVKDINVEGFLVNKEFVYPARYAPQPNIFLSNINDKFICKLRITPFTSVYKKELDEKYNNAIIGSYQTFFLPEVKINKSYNYQLSGENGIHNIACAPVDKTTIYSKNTSVRSAMNVYATDSLTNTLYQVTFFYDSSFEYQETKTITLQQLLSSNTTYTDFLSDYEYKNYSLGHIAIDGCNDVYVSIYNSDKILKLGNDLNLKNIITPEYPANKTLIVQNLSSGQINLNHNLNTFNPIISVSNITSLLPIEGIQIKPIDANNSLIILPLGVEINSQTFKINCQTQTFNYFDNIYKSPYIQADKFNRLWVTYEDPQDSGVAVFDYRGEQLDLLRLNTYTSTSSIKTQCNSIAFGYHYDSARIKVHEPCLESQKNRTPHEDTWLCVNDVVTKNNIVVEKDRGRLISIKNVDYQLGTKKIEDYAQEEYITPFKGIFNICLDRTGDVWFLHGLRYVSCFKKKTKTFVTYDIDKNGDYSIIPNSTCKYSLGENSHFTGISVDVYNRLIVVDSFYNNVYTYTAITTTPVKSSNSYIYPYSGKNHFINSNNQIVENIRNNKKSLYAFSDFTGNKWFQTYVEMPSSFTVSGISNLFKIKDLFTAEYNVRRKNESFNMAQFMEDLVLPEYMQSYETLFDIFKTTVGTDTNVYRNIHDTEKFETYIEQYSKNNIYITHSLQTGDVFIELYEVNYEREITRVFSDSDFSYRIIDKNNILITSLGNFTNNALNYKLIITNISKTRNVSDVQDLVGLKVYERIANFLENNTDIDTCNIDQLKANSNMLGVDCNSFFETRLSELQRVLDIGSVPYSKLWGTPYREVYDMKSYDTTIGDGESKVFTIKHDLNNDRVNVYTYVKFAAPYMVTFKGIVNYPVSTVTPLSATKNEIRKQIIDIFKNTGNYTLAKCKELAYSIPFDTTIGKRFVHYLTKSEAELLQDKLKKVDVVTEISTSRNFAFKNIEYFSSVEIKDRNTVVVTITSLPKETGPNIFVNITPRITSLSENISAGELLGVKNLLTQEHIAVTAPVNERQTDTGIVYERVYPLSSLHLPGTIMDEGILGSTVIVTKLGDYSAYPISYDRGLIDWDSEHTTLDKSISQDEWYKENGVLENMFNAYLTRYLCITG